jgi:hypothetical protein
MTKVRFSLIEYCYSQLPLQRLNFKILNFSRQYSFCSCSLSLACCRAQHSTSTRIRSTRKLIPSWPPSSTIVWLDLVELLNLADLVRDSLIGFLVNSSSFIWTIHPKVYFVLRYFHRASHQQIRKCIYVCLCWITFYYFEFTHYVSTSVIHTVIQLMIIAISGFHARRFLFLDTFWSNFLF